MDAEQPISKEQQEAQDEAQFGMTGAARTGDLSAEVSRKNSMKMVLVWLAVGVISLVLLTCIVSAVIVLMVLSQRPQVTPEEIAKKKELGPPKEIIARIKNINRDERTLKLLVGDGKYQTFRVTGDTVFRDNAGQPLARGFDAPELREEAMVTILTTQDRQGLQWLKLNAK